MSHARLSRDGAIAKNLNADIENLLVEEWMSVNACASKFVQPESGRQELLFLDIMFTNLFFLTTNALLSRYIISLLGGFLACGR